MENRRRHPRFRTQFDALFSTGKAEGSGILTEISRCGARLEETSLQPNVGSKVRLYLFVMATPFELVGEVVRLTDSGFAIEIVDADDIQGLIDDVTAVVSPI